MKIGIQIIHEGMDYKEIETAALCCEELGFDCVWVGDHFWWSSPEKPMLECWTLLASLASRTKKIRVGSLVLNNVFREPAIVANMANTLHEISGGRLNLGLGAGWHKKEAEMYHIDFGTSKERIDSLYSNLRYMKTMLHPDVPVWVGGFGNYILRRVVSKLADASNFERFDLSPEKCKERLDYLRTWCRKHGHQLLEKSVCLNVSFKDIELPKDSLRNLLTGDYIKLAIRDPSAVVGYVKKKMGFKTPTTIVGDAGAVLNCLKLYSDIGITYFVIRFINYENLEWLAKEVYPEVKKWRC